MQKKEDDEVAEEEQEEEKEEEVVEVEKEQCSRREAEARGAFQSSARNGRVISSLSSGCSAGRSISTPTPVRLSA